MEELIRSFNQNGIRYLVFGGQAVRLQGMPRFTMDWDIFIPGKDIDNMGKINALLKDEFDIPLVPIGAKGENIIQTYQTKWGIIQFHLAVAGLRSFEEAEDRSTERADENGVKIKTLSMEDLIATKEAVGRPQDLEDAKYLKIKAKASK